MADINSIVNADSYRGSPDAGGAGAPAIKLDTEPLFQLAHYTQLYNKNMYDQSISDRDSKIQEVAKVSQIDLNNLRGNDREEVSKQLDELKSYAQDYAKNPNRTIQGELDWQTKLQAVKSNYDSGKGRALTYYDQVNQVNGSGIPESEKKVRLKQINDKFDNSDITTPIPSQSGYKPVSINIPDAPVSQATTIKVGDNEDVTFEHDYFNPLIAAQKGTQTELGLNTLYGQKGAEGDLQNTAESEAKLWADSAAVFNSVKNAKNPDGSYKYFSPDGTFDSNKFETENSSNTAIMQPYNALKAETQYSKDKIAQIRSGAFTSGQFSFKVPSTITEDIFKPGVVDITTSDVTPSQLISAGSFTKFAGDKVTPKVQPTDNALQRSAQALTARGQTLNHEEAMARIAQDKAELEDKKAQWKSTQTGGETVKNGALLRAQRIFGDLQKLADKNGFISPDKIRQLNAEQLKYLGTEQIVTGENGIPHSVYKPLDLSGTGEFGIQVHPNGAINVMVPRNGTKLERLDNGGFLGSWDNSRSTNLLNVGTNILNEELSKAGSKELNSYLSIDAADVNNGVTTNQIGGGTSQSGSTITTADQHGHLTDHVQPSSSYTIKGKAYTKEELNKLGYTDERINAAIKQGLIK